MDYIKSKKIKLYISAYALSLALCFGVVAEAEAARLYLVPENSIYQRGSTGRLTLKIDTEDECINVIESQIVFPREILQVEAVSTGNSFLTLWIEEPKVDAEKGLISFAGGIPGGYCGSVSLDDNINTILDLYVRSASDNVDTFAVEISNDSKVLLHDGYGSPAAVSAKGAFISFVDLGEESSDEWLTAIISDLEPPEPFALDIVSDPGIYGGKHALVFSTKDRQSGLDYYEVSEVTESGKDPLSGKQPSWVRARSPYLLKDQSLNSRILVKAVDKAGNERLAEYVPDGFKFKGQAGPLSGLTVYFGIILVLLLVWLLGLSIKHLHRHKEKQ